MTDRMQWTNALSTRPSLEAAVTEVVGKVRQSLSAPPDLGVLFVSSTYGSDYPRLLPLLLEQLPLPALIGCGGAGIVGMGPEHQAVEIEGNPALSLSAAHLPGVSVHPFHLEAGSLPDLDSRPEAWVELVGVPPQHQPQFILLSDPFSSRINDLMAGLDFAYPGAVKVGGLASSSLSGMASALFCHHRDRRGQPLYREGTVGVALSGPVAIDAIVAQGCRPIGQPYRISRADRNVILALTGTEENSAREGDRSPLEVLRKSIETLDERDRKLAQESLFIGIVGDAFKQQLQPQDFLIRNLLGVDPRSGAIAIGDRIRPGQRVQFHLRDARTSEEDLKGLLENYQNEKGKSGPATGALMFSCLGRGETLYGVPNFDSRLFGRYLAEVPLGGFFCNGEIGPVGGQTFLHGYTSAFAIFRQQEGLGGGKA